MWTLYILYTLLKSSQILFNPYNNFWIFFFLLKLNMTIVEPEWLLWIRQNNSDADGSVFAKRIISKSLLNKTKKTSKRLTKLIIILKAHFSLTVLCIVNYDIFYTRSLLIKWCSKFSIKCVAFIQVIHFGKKLKI